jgi:hypothetical protein
MINIRNTRWAAVAAAAVIVLASGYWAGRSQATSTATPRAESGVVSFTGTDGLTISLPGQSQPTGYALPDTVPWSDAYGNWNDGGRPVCLRHGQHITPRRRLHPGHGRRQRRRPRRLGQVPAAPRAALPDRHPVGRYALTRRRQRPLEEKCW